MGQSVSIVGAGRVGSALGRRLRELGWTVGVVVTRSQGTARAAVRRIGAGSAHAGLTRRVVASDLVLLATPDDAMSQVARALARIGGEEWRRRVVLHTSGALDHSVLAPFERLGASTGSLHPLQTFTGRGTPRLEGVIFAVEGDRRALRLARQIARGLGGMAVTVSGKDKAAYHAAGAFVAGHLLAVVEAATRILASLGFSRRRAIRALLPLLRQTLENFERLGPRAAWTGPVSRGDFATVVRHLRALSRFPAEFPEAYRALSLLGARVLAENPKRVRKRLRGAFEEASGGLL